MSGVMRQDQNAVRGQGDLPLVRLSAFRHLRPRKGKRGETATEVVKEEGGGEGGKEGEEKEKERSWHKGHQKRGAIF